MKINFLFLNQKLHIKYTGKLVDALDYLEYEYGFVKIHSVRPKTGPILIFKDLPTAGQIKHWYIKRQLNI